jgi:hypothetical protein
VLSRYKSTKHRHHFCLTNLIYHDERKLFPHKPNTFKEENMSLNASTFNELKSFNYNHFTTLDTPKNQQIQNIAQKTSSSSQNGAISGATAIAGTKKPEFSHHLDELLNTSKCNDSCMDQYPGEKQILQELVAQTEKQLPPVTHLPPWVHESRNLHPTTLDNPRDGRNLHPTTLDNPRDGRNLHPTTLDNPRDDRNLHPTTLDNPRDDRNLHPTTLDNPRDDRNLHPTTLDNPRDGRNLHPLI